MAGPAPPRLAEVVHQRTDGNALFMVMVVDELLAASRSAAAPEVAAGGLDAVAAALPDGVRQMVERQIERFAADDVALLEAAALARFEFSAALARRRSRPIRRRSSNAARSWRDSTSGSAPAAWSSCREATSAPATTSCTASIRASSRSACRPRARCACTAASASGSSACRATRPRRSWPCISNTAATPCARSTICARRRERRWRATPTAKRSPCWRGRWRSSNACRPSSAVRSGARCCSGGDWPIAPLVTSTRRSRISPRGRPARAPTAKARKRSRPSSPPARRGRSAIARCSSRSPRKRSSAAARSATVTCTCARAAMPRTASRACAAGAPATPRRPPTPWVRATRRPRRAARRASRHARVLRQHAGRLCGSGRGRR